MAEGRSKFDTTAFTLSDSKSRSGMDLPSSDEEDAEPDTRDDIQRALDEDDNIGSRTGTAPH